MKSCDSGVKAFKKRKAVFERRDNGALPIVNSHSAHFRALPCGEVGGALGSVEVAASLAAHLCFRFLALTAVRSKRLAARGWSDMDLQTPNL